MESLLIVKLKVFSEVTPTIRNAGILFQINLLIFDRPPKTLDHDIIKCSTSAIHADPNRFSFEDPDKLFTGKLAPLIRVEYVRLVTAAECFFRAMNTELISRVGESSQAIT